MKKYLSAVLLALAPVLALAPALAFASTDVFTNISNSAGLGQGGGLQTTIQALAHTINLAIPIFIGLAVIFFIYAVIKYVIATGPDDKKAARSVLIYGVIAIAVIILLFGLVNFLGNLFGISGTTSVAGPQITQNS
jgi:hypothetical protein